MKPTTRLRVAILEANELARHSLQWLLESCTPFTTVVAVFATIVDSLASLSDARPDLLLVSAKLLSADCIELISYLRLDLPALTVLVVAANEDADEAVEAIRAGAHACVLQEHAVDQLGPAIHAIHRGERWFCPQATLWLASGPGRVSAGSPTQSADSCPLSARELLVLRERSKHLSYKEIARNHAISPETARWYANNARQKINAASVADALRTAIHAGWLRS